MTIHVDIGEAKTRLSELVAAAVRGKDVILARAGHPQVRLVAVAEASQAERARIAAKRKAAIGMFAREFEGFDIDIKALRADRTDTDERLARQLGPAD